MALRSESEIRDQMFKVREIEDKDPDNEPAGAVYSALQWVLGLDSMTPADRLE
jgi:hypothetical protein